MMMTRKQLSGSYFCSESSSADSAVKSHLAFTRDMFAVSEVTHAGPLTHADWRRELSSCVRSSCTCRSSEPSVDCAALQTKGAIELQFKLGSFMCRKSLQACDGRKFFLPSSQRQRDPKSKAWCAMRSYSCNAPLPSCVVLKVSVRSHYRRWEKKCLSSNSAKRVLFIGRCTLQSY